MIEFETQIISIAKSEFDVLNIAMADSEEMNRYAIIQYSEELDEQDKALGMTRYYLEIGPDYAAGAYDCIEHVAFNDLKLLIQFNSKGKAHFEDEGMEVEISKDIGEETISQLRNALVTAFEDEENVSTSIARK